MHMIALICNVCLIGGGGGVQLGEGLQEFDLYSALGIVWHWNINYPRLNDLRLSRPGIGLLYARRKLFQLNHRGGQIAYSLCLNAKYLAFETKMMRFNAVYVGIKTFIFAVTHKLMCVWTYTYLRLKQWSLHLKAKRMFAFLLKLCSIDSQNS